MKERSFDEMIAYFNRRASKMDIAQDYKMELLGMVTALGYKHQQTTRRWIPCSERLPDKPDGYPHCGIHRTYFLVSLESGCVETLAYEFDRDEWQITGSPVKAWMPLPEPYREGES